MNYVKTAYYLLTYDVPKDGEYGPMKSAIAELSQNRIHAHGPETTFLFQVDGVSFNDMTQAVLAEVTKHLDRKHGCATLVNLTLRSVFEKTKGQKWNRLHSMSAPFQDWDEPEDEGDNLLKELIAHIIDEES